MEKLSHGIVGLLLVLLVSLAAGSANAQTASEDIEFQLPLACTPGVNCWVANYVDQDPGPGAEDFTCGPRSYHTHTGTDFALRDMSVLLRGVQVLAAADGTVQGVRHSMPDTDFRRLKPEVLKGNECGNGVRIVHKGGWETQYCHMRERSMLVNTSDIVKAGQPLGLIGLSGRTEFPHLHFVVRRNGKVVDPFVGDSGIAKCGIGAKPLWASSVSALLKYEPAALYNVGVSQVRPTSEGVRHGLFRNLLLDAKILVLYPWVDVLGPRQGDTLNMRLVDPKGNVIWQRDATFQKTFARAFRARRINVKGTSLPTGTYKAEFSLTRKSSAGNQTVRTSSRVTVK